MFAVDESVLVRAAVAPMHVEARISSAQTSQVVAGRVVTVLAQHHDWWHVRSADAYEGWVHQGYLERASGDEDSWGVSLGASIRAVDGSLQALPVSARFSPNCTVVRGDTVTAQALSAKFPRVASAVTASAVRLFSGSSYQWGGITEWGCDCSGLVQTVFALHGTVLPRDAHQQATCGDTVGSDGLGAQAQLEAASEGDLLFFSDRADKRLTHVGIAMANAHMVHSALGRGGVRVENLRADDSYVARLRQNFVLARRIWTTG